MATSALIPAGCGRTYEPRTPYGHASGLVGTVFMAWKDPAKPKAQDVTAFVVQKNWADNLFMNRDALSHPPPHADTYVRSDDVWIPLAGWSSSISSPPHLVALIWVEANDCWLGVDSAGEFSRYTQDTLANVPADGLIAPDDHSDPSTRSGPPSAR